MGTRKGIPAHLTPDPAAVLATYTQATDDEWNAGMAWYPQALALATELEPDAPEFAAGVIAALSPQCSWERNVELARRVYATGTTGGQTHANVAKALAIYSHRAHPLDVLGGDKVRAFYRAIVGDTSAVVIDRHAFDVATGRLGTDESRRVLARAGAYDAYAGAYRAAAAEVGIPATALQAITWLTWRRLWDVSDDGVRRGAGSRSHAREGMAA